MSSLYRLIDLASDEPFNLLRCLFKAKLFSARLPGKKFREWVTRELEGYPSRGDVPAYRVVTTPPIGHFTNLFGDQQQTIPFSTAGLPPDWRSVLETYAFTEHAKALESLLTRDPSVLIRKWDPETIATVSAHPSMRVEGMILTDAESPIPKPAVEEVLYAIRTALLNFLMTLWEKYPDLDRAEDPSEIAEGSEVDRLVDGIIYLSNSPLDRAKTLRGITSGLKVSLGSHHLGSDSNPAPTDPVQKLIGELADALTQAVEELSQQERFEAVDEFESLTREASRDSPRPERLRTYAAGLKSAFALVAGERPAVWITAKTDALLAYFGANRETAPADPGKKKET